MMKSARTSCVVGMLLVVACGDRGERGAATSGTGKDTAAWVVTPQGVGPLKAGMSPAQATKALRLHDAVKVDSAWKNCDHVAIGSLPVGVAVMVEQGIIGRIEVNEGHVATAEGARIGDTEERIKALYGNRVTVSPHKYTAGHYLTVRSSEPNDSLFRIVFETDGQKVTRYRSGRAPQVEYVEGCG